MIYSPKNITVMLFFIMSQLGALDTTMRFSIGPAWHNFNSTQYFTLIGGSFIEETTPALEIIKSNYFLMPYAQYDITLLSKKYFAHVFVGGGATARARGLVEQPTAVIKKSLLTIDRGDSRVSPSILIADAHIGFRYRTCFCDILVNPMLGYVFNNEKITLETLAKSVLYFLKNHWQGPYLGFVANVPLTNNFSLNGLYKFVISRLHSRLNFYNPSTLNIPHTSPENACAKAFGTIVGLELTYTPDCTYTLGTACTYMNYKNHTIMSVNLGASKPAYLESSFIQAIQWQQILWTFFCEFLF